MREYICKEVPTENGGYLEIETELIRCKDCKYWLPHHQFGFDSDNDEYRDYCAKHLPEDDYYAFEKNANDYCSLAKLKVME